MQKKQLTKTFFLTGGGTGGHIYPCISILNELQNKGEKRVFYIGNKKNAEYEIVSGLPYNVEFLDVPVFGMPRKITLKLVKWLFLLGLSILKCLFYALSKKPDVVFASGGYVSAPMVITAKILKIPYVMHDSDAHPGIVTRAFSGSAAAVNLAFQGANRFVKSNNITNFQNPVRSEFFTISKAEARKELNIKDDFTVLIMGGSQGAKTINNAAIEAIKHFQNKNDVKIIFQTGKKNYTGVINELETVLGVKEGQMPQNITVKPYFEKMYIPLLASDVVVSRAGSLSISEILAAKKPSILVPYPYAAADHQRKNAKEIEKTGASVYIEDSDLNGEILINTIENLLKNPEELRQMAQKASWHIPKNPTPDILNLILKAAKTEA